MASSVGSPGGPCAEFKARLGPIVVFILYSVGMGALFLVATIIYLVIAHVYRGGGF